MCVTCPSVGVKAVDPGNEGWSGTPSVVTPCHGVKSLKENMAGASGGLHAFPLLRICVRVTENSVTAALSPI